ncbi:TPA: replication initiation protein [Streptococcus suis]|uniref:Rep family protein n=2 Tax=Streptococcus suis TaxID=1307 RepID=UPI00195FD723|nr:Rep family protein [Streptococcus suis]MBM7138092.1 replication initiation protein [Streptococcus suis]MBY4600873.1 replication initiation protein [Streptococcus suis]MCO8202909.1 Rep family protein [Streptococcus suis]HEM3442014.1 replication initiation protein [Streptococcus suis]HEM3445990.1 replication initiation protein [Streptococcus suis]
MKKKRKMSEKVPSIRHTAYMFCSTVESVSIKNLQEIIKLFQETLNPFEIAGIIHDKDIDSEPHYHIIVRFKNAVWLNSIINKLSQNGFEVQPNFFEAWKGKVNNAYSYLIHRTEDASEKYQYPVDEVFANFDYAERIESIESKIQSNSRNEKTINVVRNLINKIIDGDITFDEAIKEVDGYTLVKYDREFSKAKKRRTEIDFENWKENALKNGFKREIIWLYGPSGTGKSRLCKHFAKSLGKPFYTTGSSRDPFQNVGSQETIIIEEIRPGRGGNFNYADFLLIIDPFNADATASSRFFDKPIIATTIIINTPFSPSQFYESISKQAGFDKKIDTLTQLIRRITLLQEVTDKSIITYKFDNKKNEYVEHERIGNPYYEPEKDKIEFNSDVYDKYKKMTLKISKEEDDDRQND